MSLVAFLIVSIPWVAGGLFALAIQGILSSSSGELAAHRQQLPTIFTFGLGGLLGYLTLGYTLWAFDKFSLPALTPFSNTVIACITLAALTIFWLRPRRVNVTITGVTGWALGALLMALMAYAAYMQNQNPLFAWDGLDHWSFNAAEFIKDKTSAEQPNFTNMYLEKHPKTVVLINAWAGWVNYRLGGHAWATPWLLCMISICMMSASYVHESTKSSTLAMLCAVITATLPLAETHTLIAGYSELWLSAATVAGLLLTALGLKHQHFYWVVAGMLTGALATTLKNTGLGYSLCVWGALIGTFMVCRPRVTAILVPMALGVGFWLWTNGFDVNLFALNLQWIPERNVLVAAGKHLKFGMNPIGQIGINELYSLVLNQSFSTVVMMLIFSVVFAFHTPNHRKTSCHQNISNQKSAWPGPTAATTLLIIGALITLAMITLTQVFLADPYQYGLPNQDTSITRFSLPLALLTIPTVLSAVTVRR